MFIKLKTIPSCFRSIDVNSIKYFVLNIFLVVNEFMIKNLIQIIKAVAFGRRLVTGGNI